MTETTVNVVVDVDEPSLRAIQRSSRVLEEVRVHQEAIAALLRENARLLAEAIRRPLERER